MANQEHLKILEQGIAAWNNWRTANPEIKPDLSTADLIAADLSAADLSTADLSAAYLIGTNLHEAKLSNANLVEANLGYANLGHANLSAANLSHAKLLRANLSKSNFGYANLSEANLNEADLSAANLSYANLYGANLYEAKLHGADLCAADLTETTVGHTGFGNLDLSAVKGMETIKHIAPSTIGIDTIYLSQGKIPAGFLKGAGVPETFITYMESLVAAMSPIEFYSCFISYSHKDKTFAHKLYDELKNRGIRCWLDEHQLLPGDDIYHQVDRGIRLWDKVLLCCSESSLKSWWVDNEIGVALEKEQQLTKQRGHKVHVLIPLNLDGCFFSQEWISGYQAQLRRRLAADFMGLDNADDNKFAGQIKKLVLALRADERAREQPPAPRL